MGCSGRVLNAKAKGIVGVRVQSNNGGKGDAGCTFYSKEKGKRGHGCWCLGGWVRVRTIQFGQVGRGEGGDAQIGGWARPSGRTVVSNGVVLGSIQ